jgi:hypothetical protein
VDHGHLYDCRPGRSHLYRSRPESLGECIRIPAPVVDGLSSEHADRESIERVANHGTSQSGYQHATVQRSRQPVEGADIRPPRAVDLPTPATLPDSPGHKRPIGLRRKAGPTDQSDNRRARGEQGPAELTREGVANHHREWEAEHRK